jgi:hypothetical protein
VNPFDDIINNSEVRKMIKTSNAGIRRGPQRVWRNVKATMYSFNTELSNEVEDTKRALAQTNVNEYEQSPKASLKKTKPDYFKLTSPFKMSQNLE